MPRLSGRELLAAIRSQDKWRTLPVVFLTARAGTEAKIERLDAGADDYVAKPFDEQELLARIRNLLRSKEQERELANLNIQLKDLNDNLETRVRKQVVELDNLGRLKRFFSPHLAEMILKGGAEDPLKSHRRKVAVVFVDLRGFTVFSETAEPEEVMEVLRNCHEAMGEIVLRHEGTLERFMGDGMMVIFNDPVKIPDAAARAIRMALDVRQQINELREAWRKMDYRLDAGVGIAQGYATIGAIGFPGRLDYGSIGSVCNLASRLCDAEKPGQILISKSVFSAEEEHLEVEPIGELQLKGFRYPVTTYELKDIVS